ncbi:hypothetical protein BJX62DRAFT_46549 [Aspergillus germanicus]
MRPVNLRLSRFFFLFFFFSIIPNLPFSFSPFLSSPSTFPCTPIQPVDCTARTYFFLFGKGIKRTTNPVLYSWFVRQPPLLQLIDCGWMALALLVCVHVTLR